MERSRLWRFGLLVCIIGIACLVQPARAQTRAASRPVSDAALLKVAESYGKLPLSFEVNQGQSDSQVKFLSQGSGYTLSLTPTEAALALWKSDMVAGGSSKAIRTESIP